MTHILNLVVPLTTLGPKETVEMNFNSILHRIYPNWVLLMLNQYIRSLFYALVYTEVLEPCVNFLLEAHHKSQESWVAGTN